MAQPSPVVPDRPHTFTDPTQEVAGSSPASSIQNGSAGNEVPSRDPAQASLPRRSFLRARGDRLDLGNALDLALLIVEVDPERWPRAAARGSPVSCRRRRGSALTRRASCWPRCEHLPSCRACRRDPAVARCDLRAKRGRSIATEHSQSTIVVIHDHQATTATRPATPATARSLPRGTRPTVNPAAMAGVTATMAPRPTMTTSSQPSSGVCPPCRRS
jgi:hypothetical protein